MAETNSSFPKILRRGFLVALAVFILTVVGGVVLVWSILPKVYSATAEIQIRPEGVKSVAEIDKSDWLKGRKPFQTEFEAMQTPELLLAVISELQLDQKWAQRFGTGEEKLQPVEAYAHMLLVLKVSLKREPNLVDITALSEDPTEAAAIANAIMDRYKNMCDANVQLRNQKGVEALRDQVEQQTQLVAEKKAAAEKLPESNDSLEAQREVGEHQTILDACTLRLQQMIAERSLLESPVRIILRAAVPTAPSRPSLKHDLPVIVFLGVFLGVGTAASLEVVFWIGRRMRKKGAR